MTQGDTTHVRAAGAADDGPAAGGPARQGSTRRLSPVGPLWLLGVLLLPTVVVTAVVLPLTPSRLARNSAGLIEEQAVWSWVAGLPWPALEGTALAVALVVTAGWAFLVQGVAVVACWDRAPTRAALLAVLVPAVVFLAVSAFALPTQSSDMIDYLLSGRVAAVHGASPYEVAPDAFPDDPLLPYASGDYTGDPEQKPPLWIAAAILLARLAGNDPAVAVLVVRLALMALSLVNLALIAAVLHRRRPRHLLAGLVLYGWSPLVALHGQAKFDTLMATFALLAALLLVTRRRYGVMPVLWMSVLVKLLTLPLLAAYLLGEAAGRRWRSLAAGAALVLVVTVLAYASFGAGPGRLVEHLGLTERGGASLPGVLGVVAALAVVALVVRVGLTSRGDAERLLQGWALISLATALVTPIGWAWYLIAPLAVVSLSGERWRTAAAVSLTAVAYLADLWTRSRADLPESPLSRSTAFVLALVLVAVAVAAYRAYRRWPR